MPSMSYCMFENTSMELDQVIEAMENAESLDEMDLNVYEKVHFYRMWDQARRFLAEHERLLNKEHA